MNEFPHIESGLVHIVIGYIAEAVTYDTMNTTHLQQAVFPWRELEGWMSLDLQSVFKHTVHPYCYTTALSLLFSTAYKVAL